jgi:hypothetical protein
LIPLSKLIARPANVRRTERNDGIEELAASIKAHGLLQNLQVRAGAGGKFEVVAEQRRLAALPLLAKAKGLPKSAEIPCHVCEAEAATEISLAENIMRLPMHPADQYEAFKAVADQGNLPQRADGLWDWLLAQETAMRLDLLAYCAGCSVNAVKTAQERTDAERLVHTSLPPRSISTWRNGGSRPGPAT